MRKDKKQLLSGIAGATMLLSGCAASVPAPEAEVNENVVSVKNDVIEENGFKLTPQDQKAIEFIAVPNVEGAFAFDQNVISPSDKAFNLLGTVMTGVCAKPDFVFEEGYEDLGTHYINVSGHMKESYTVTLEEMEGDEETTVMSCSCATGTAVINAEVGGIPLSSILQLAELEEGANTVTVRGSDGYGIAMPLSFALDKEAMIVYRVNGEDLPAYESTQMWIPGTVAKYFTRDVVEIEVTAEDEVPAVIEAEAEYRNHISIVNHADEESFAVGEAIVFEGYADDYDKAIAAIEVSMDGGETWTTYETTGATSDKWVYWYFTYTPEAEGTYKLMVRAVNEDGNVTPLATTLFFYAEEAQGM